MGLDMNQGSFRKAKAKAIALPQTAEDRWLFLIHAFLALLAPFLIFALVGCESKMDGDTVDYGPAIPFSQISNAILQGVQNIDPAESKKGAFVHYSTKQYLAAGKVVSIASDTGLTVTQRVESPAGVTLTLVEKKFIYRRPGESAQEESREYTLEFPTLNSTNDSFAASDESSITPLSSSAVVSALQARMNSGAQVTFHNLVTSTRQVPAPAAVQSQPGCLGLPGCLITLHQVSFDQVVRDAEGTQRIHFDFYVSPNIPQISGFNMSPVFPFYQGLFKSCVTLMVAVGDGRSKTLLSECQEVENFRFESPPTP
jgi:hypothetical protein